MFCSGTRLVFPTQSHLLVPHWKFAGWGSEGSRDLAARAPRVPCASSVNRLFLGLAGNEESPLTPDGERF